MAASPTKSEGEGPYGKKKLHFVIVGGSLGGLAAGVALKALGHDTTVLERAGRALLRDQGAGIVAGGDTLAFLARYDRCGRPVAVASRARQYLDLAGGVVHAEEARQQMTSWDLMYHLLRANYDGVVSAYCDAPAPVPGHGAAVHLHDRTVTDIKREQDGDGNEGVRVFWRSGSGSGNGSGEEKEEGSVFADVVVGADGPSSTVRALVQPGVERRYAGYCALRGTVPEGEASAAARRTCGETFTFYHGPGVQALTYLIPGPGGAVEPGRRLVNFVYYANFPAGSAALEEIMTGRDGRRRAVTVGPGAVDRRAWARQRGLARARLPPQLADVVCAARRPFVQAVTDVLSPEHEYWGGRVVLVGDALAGFRPHTVASTSQAAFDAMLFADYVAGKVGRAEWKRQTLGFARFVHRRGVEMGERSQHMDLPLEACIRDRNVASTPRQEEVYPDWATTF
ncbi:putative 2-polyprenyl-6-methoxyphenol hydroxylase-like oxidoreductase protein [Rosellinia necatrix]|uniref:Putative 2-polyprenyl-6-methoxyphenol hydroxylase-like oxidoreductase protein n=1 Tax=Rosellinia necatrix TaxID=77044 RepID=A0A1S8A9R2_ROSNE|nr:putative 2-polyprenyl-6-methoxyphenol hydroxylase-like oxidoreductase protein [Rosellinia necatrix]